jgi:hypothetical protein
LFNIFANIRFKFVSLLFDLKKHDFRLSSLCPLLSVRGHVFGNGSALQAGQAALVPDKTASIF